MPALMTLAIQGASTKREFWLFRQVVLRTERKERRKAWEDCVKRRVSGAPTAVGGRGLQPDSSLSPTLISDSTCGGEPTGSLLHYDATITILWCRTVSSCVVYIAGQRLARAASSSAAAGARAQLETTTASTETQNRGFLWSAVFHVLD